MQMSQVFVGPETAFLSGWGEAPLVYGFEIAILKPGPYQLRVAAWYIAGSLCRAEAVRERYRCIEADGIEMSANIRVFEKIDAR